MAQYHPPAPGGGRGKKRKYKRKRTIFTELVGVVATSGLEGTARRVSILVVVAVAVARPHILADKDGGTSGATSNRTAEISTHPPQNLGEVAAQAPLARVGTRVVVRGLLIHPGCHDTAYIRVAHGKVLAVGSSAVLEGAGCRERVGPDLCGPLKLVIPHEGGRDAIGLSLVVVEIQPGGGVVEGFIEGFDVVYHRSEVGRLGGGILLEQSSRSGDDGREKKKHRYHAGSPSLSLTHLPSLRSSWPLLAALPQTSWASLSSSSRSS
jgi:hypothetical protein